MLKMRMAAPSSRITSFLTSVMGQRIGSGVMNESPFKFDNGQQDDDPPLTDVIVQGNIVQSIGQPRYRFAVIIAGGPDGPRGMRFYEQPFPLWNPGCR